MALDPLIAAAGYLQQIPPAAHALADAATTQGEWRSALGWAADGLILLAVLKSRVLPFAERWTAPKLSRPWLRTPMIALLFALVLEAGCALVSAVLGTVWPTGASAPAALIAALPLHIIGDLILSLILLAAVRRWPRRWWMGLSAVLAGLIALVILGVPMLFSPVVRHDRVVTTSVGAPLLAFARKGGLDAHALYVFDSADPADVDAEGVGPLAHLAISRAALTAPQPQTYAAIGHLLGHHRHKDLWSMTLLLAALATLGLALVAKLTRPLAKALGETGIGGPADPLALPVVGLILWIFALPGGVAFDAFDRGVNYRADAYALSLTHDPQGFARWLIQSEAKGKADPAWLEMVLFYDHPPLKARLVRALTIPPL